MSNYPSEWAEELDREQVTPLQAARAAIIKQWLTFAGEPKIVWTDPDDLPAYEKGPGPN